MVDKGISSFIPGQVHEAHRPFASSGWEVAVLMYTVALWLTVIGWLVYGFSVGFHYGLGGLFVDGPLLLVGSAVSVVTVTLVVRLQGPHADHLARQLLDASLTLFFLLGLLFIVIGIIGFFAAFTDGGFGSLVYDLFLHLADVAVGVLVIVWALGEIATLKNSAPSESDGEVVAAGAGSPLTPPASPYTAPPATVPPTTVPPTTMPPFAPPPAPPTSTLPTVPPPQPPNPPNG